MSQTITVKNLNQELSFIKDKDAQVFCRDLGYGYQLFFIDKNLNEIGRIFIRRVEVTDVTD